MQGLTFPTAQQVRLPNFPSQTCRKHSKPSLQPPKFRFTLTNTQFLRSGGGAELQVLSPAGDGSSDSPGKLELVPNPREPGGAVPKSFPPWDVPSKDGSDRSQLLSWAFHGSILRPQGEWIIFHTRVTGITWDLCPPFRWQTELSCHTLIRRMMVVILPCAQ